jgi:ABC-type branched-subunit amino acid transport system substrate-binding protein/DNA-binding beta-propeller fold protein YncE
MTVALPEGTIFAGYRIESLVARGGMGIVYRAADPSLHRPVALKLIAPEFAEDDRFRRRFLRESRLAASLDHPGVVPIYEAGEHEGTLYLAMRFVDGSDLRTLLRRDGTLGAQRSLPLLAQVAGALDAAHRSGLVHRDVKPGNVLVDEGGYAYLTDFGVSKQLGGDSTDTGRMVGTLDYLAPEQIRGQPVDGRADQYALACVLYECLAGTPPFRRETEGETLWAHMQDVPPALPGHEALDRVLARGLAKEPGDRYESCSALIDGAYVPRVPWRLMRRRRAILAAGVVLLAGLVAAALMAGRGSRTLRSENGVAQIGSDGARSFTRFEGGAGDIAVGEGAVWVVDSQDATISKVDPETARPIRTFDSPPRLLDIVAGAGALWLANALADGRRDTVSRIDTRTGAVTHTVKLPRTPERGGWPSEGHPLLAVGAGAVWAGNREGTISRIDPKTGEVTATIDAYARRIAAGKEGVWVLGIDLTTITRIDPRTNRIGQSIHLGTNAVTGLAVGAGSVWAATEEDRLIRVEPGPRPIQQTIEVGSGTEFVAFGAGAVWTADFVGGTVSRIDPHANRVTATVPVGAVQAIAAGAGSAWVSVAGGTNEGVLPASMCREVSSGGRKPDVLIASDFALRGSDGADSRNMADTIFFVLEQRGFRAGRFTVGYRSCDDSTAHSGRWERRRCAANANAYARADNLVAVIGTIHSDCSRVEIPILNRAPAGPLALVSSVNVYPNLTRGGRLKLAPPSGRRGEPDVYYPTGARNFVRVIGRSDQEGVAAALLAKELGLRRVYLLYSSFGNGKVLWTGPFRRTAEPLGIGIAGEEEASDDSVYAAVARRVARARVDGVLLGAGADLGGDKLLKRLRARLGPEVTIIGGSGYAYIPELLERAGRAARGMYVATTEVTANGPGMTAAAKRFAAEFGTASHGSYALQTAQATEVVLQAIARSDGTRASVLRQLHATRVRDGLVGDFGFDRYGDVTPARVTILRVTGSTPAGVELPPYLHGAVVDRVLSVPANLAG